MCGIICYTGTQDAKPILLQGLQTLEYRGYDSAGIGLARAGSPALQVIREVGEVQRLTEKAGNGHNPATCGIGHTRWASHGKPSIENSHPHQDCRGDVIVVHNGDLEDHLALKRELESRGHVFKSETDTEVIAHLLEENRQKGLPPVLAIGATLAAIRGTYALGIIFADFPDCIFLAKLSGSLVLHKASHGTLAASDTTAILPYGRDVVYLRDHDIAMLTPQGFELFAPDASVLSSRATEMLEGSPDELKKDGHPYFMRKELYTQPECLANLLRSRLDYERGTAVLGGIRSVEEPLKHADRLILTGCGSAYYAGLIGKRYFETFAGIPTQSILANQLPFDPTPITSTTAVISITQSGVTADTVEAQREAKQRSALTLGIVNAVGTTIPRENSGGVYLRVGPESGVASTKAFTAQAAALAMVALCMGRMRGMTLAAGQEVVKALSALPKDAERMITASNALADIAQQYQQPSMYYLGAGAFLPTALEGALKLKEIAYIHAEAYASGEMKHGPLALVDKGFPVLVLAPDDVTWSQTASALAKLHAIGAHVLLLTDSDKPDIRLYANDLIVVPRTPSLTAPILWTILLQRFAYEVAVSKGLNPDRPRHLAKTITVR